MGLLIELLLEAPLFLGQKIQSIVADLGQTDPLDGPAAGCKGVVGLLALACDAAPVLLHERFVDGLPVFFRGVLQLSEGCV